MANSPTQRERILEVLRKVGRNFFNPTGYTNMQDGHRWISSRYFKQVLLISECNGRISEARADGYDIATLDGEKDEYGFAYHRLVEEPKKRVVSYEEVYEDGRVVRMREVVKFV